MASGRGRGAMSANMKLVRFFLIVLNFTFIIAGIVFLLVGIYVVNDAKMQQLRPLLTSDLPSKPADSLSNVEIFALTVILLGGILLVIGFLGCCGTVRIYRFLHVYYVIILGGIILIELSFILVYIVYQNHFKSTLIGHLQDSIAKYYTGIPMDNSTFINSISLSWEFTQYTLHCCGARSKDDYLRAVHWNRFNPYQRDTNLSVPFTCCPLGTVKRWNQLPINMTEAMTCATTGRKTYSTGCFDRLADIFAVYKNQFIVGLIIACLLQVLAFVSAFSLYWHTTDYNTL